MSNNFLNLSNRSKIEPFDVMRIVGEVEKARRAGLDVISLTAGEPPYRPLNKILKSGGYTATLGILELRKAIATHYKRWYNADVATESIAVTTGSSGGFLAVMMALFDAGDKVAVATPGYPAYGNILRTLGVKPVEIATKPELGYILTPEDLDEAKKLNGEINGIILASPANPTGTMLDRSQLTNLIGWAKLNNAWVISDEIYHGITYPQDGAEDPHGVSAITIDPNVIVVNSFSKYWGMTGWRLGWVIAPPSVITAVDALSSNLSLCPPAPAQEFALNAFDEEVYDEREKLRQEFAKARQLLIEAEDSLSWGVAAPSEGAFYYYADLGQQLEKFGDSKNYAKQLLEKAHVALVPGYDFDSEMGHRTFRLSYAVGPKELERAIERIIDFHKKF